MKKLLSLLLCPLNYLRQEISWSAKTNLTARSFLVFAMLICHTLWEGTFLTNPFVVFMSTHVASQLDPEYFTSEDTRTINGEESIMTEIELTESTLLIHVKGVHKILALKSQLEIPLTHVVGAEIDPTVVNLKEIRAPGTGLPGVIKAGSFRLEGQWAFWDVHDPQKAITIKLADEHFTKLVIEVTNPAAAVAQIEEAVRARKSS
jgi:hypothetical protein